MSKKLFIFLTILMSLSLVGIVFVQGYFINKSFENEEERFSLSVRRALAYTSDRVSEIEYNKYVNELNRILAQGNAPDTTALRNISVYKENDEVGELVVYNTGIFS